MQIGDVDLCAAEFQHLIRFFEHKFETKMSTPALKLKDIAFFKNNIPDFKPIFIDCAKV